MVNIVYRSSFSQHNTFEKCQYTWWLQSIKKTQVISDMSNAQAGNVVHKSLQKFYNEKTLTVDEVKIIFNKLWLAEKLDETKLVLRQDEFWLCVLNGMKLKDELIPTSTEFKIFFNDALAYIDFIDTTNDIIADWKTSIRIQENDIEYTKQVIFYSWMFFRKFGRLPKKCYVYYLKFNGSKMTLEITPTMEQVLEIENWYNKILAQMEDILYRGVQPTKCSECHIFCPYKNLCFDSENTVKYTLKVLNNYIFLDGYLTPLLNKQLHKKFSYELKNSYYIKKYNPNINTIIDFWNEKRKLIPIGFKNSLLKTLNDYSEWLKKKNDKTVVIDIEDLRTFNPEKVEMPEKFINGVILRDYQNEAVEIFLRNKIGGLQIITGAGKTEIAIEVIRRLGYKTLFVTERKELLFQTKERIEKALGIKVGIIGSGEKELQHITVGTIQTLNKHIIEFKDYLKDIRVVVFDEAHHVPSRSYLKLGNYLPNTEYRLLLSGTLTRDDGNEMMIFATGGDIIFNVTANEMIEKGFLIQPTIIFIKEYMTEDDIVNAENLSSEGLINETSSYPLYYKNFISENNKRNNVIKTICEKHPNTKILILTKLIEHGETIKSLIPTSEHLWGATEKELRKDILERFVKGDLNILISTISIFSEGIDLPILGGVINLAANSGDVKTIQILGRILRIMEGKKNAFYYDFIDESKYFKRASFKRRKALIQQGHDVDIKSSKDI